MTGGSFDYLYFFLESDVTDALELAGARLREMATWLESQGEQAAANAVRTQAEHLESAVPQAGIIPVVKAAEWWASRDTGREAFKEAWEKYTDWRRNNAVPHP